MFGIYGLPATEYGLVTGRGFRKYGYVNVRRIIACPPGCVAPCCANVYCTPGCVCGYCLNTPVFMNQPVVRNNMGQLVPVNELVMSPPTSEEEAINNKE